MQQPKLAPTLQIPEPKTLNHPKVIPYLFGSIHKVNFEVADLDDPHGRLGLFRVLGVGAVNIRPMMHLSAYAARH